MMKEREPPNKRTQLPEGYFNERPGAGKTRNLIVSFSCIDCKKIHETLKSKIWKKKYLYCHDCYQKSPERKITAKKIVANRPTYDGAANPNFRGGAEERTCPCGVVFHKRTLPNERGTTKHKYCSMACRARNSVSIAEHVVYAGTKFRSSWEAKVAEVLDSRGISWVYEPASFETPFGFYRPDFFVPSWGAYLEVKGFFRDENSRLEFEWFSGQYWCHLVDSDALVGFGLREHHGRLAKAGLYVKRPRIKTARPLSEVLGVACA
jgi:hypothetical protein